VFRRHVSQDACCRYGADMIPRAIVILPTTFDEHTNSRRRCAAFFGPTRAQRVSVSAISRRLRPVGPASMNQHEQTESFFQRIVTALHDPVPLSTSNWPAVGLGRDPWRDRPPPSSFARTSTKSPIPISARSRLLACNSAACSDSGPGPLQICI
jgi:hypothetical protein